MKKIILILLAQAIAIIAFCQPNSQMSSGGQSNNDGSIFHKGQTNFNIGLGLISRLRAATQSSYGTAKTVIPPISATLDFATSDKVSWGVYLGYTSEKLTDYWSDIKISHVILGVRYLRHFKVTDANDFYWGAMFGYNIAKASSGGDASSVTGITYGFLIGGRHYFNPNTAFLGELGYGISWLNIGLSFKINQNINQQKK